jgi:hypothetical protein
MARYYLSSPTIGPFGRILAAVLAVLVFAGILVFGAIVLAIGVVLGLILWIGFAIRHWWLRRTGVEQPPGSESNQSETIEAEYTVISRRRD